VLSFFLGDEGYTKLRRRWVGKGNAYPFVTNESRRMNYYYYFMGGISASEA